MRAIDKQCIFQTWQGLIVVGLSYLVMLAEHLLFNSSESAK